METAGAATATLRPRFAVLRRAPASLLRCAGWPAPHCRLPLTSSSRAVGASAALCARSHARLALIAAAAAAAGGISAACPMPAVGVEPSRLRARAERSRPGRRGSAVVAVVGLGSAGGEGAGEVVLGARLRRRAFRFSAKRSRSHARRWSRAAPPQSSPRSPVRSNGRRSPAPAPSALRLCPAPALPAAPPRVLGCLAARRCILPEWPCRRCRPPEPSASNSEAPSYPLRLPRRATADRDGGG
jgi:hypothetical protein